MRGQDITELVVASYYSPVKTSYWILSHQVSLSRAKYDGGCYDLSSAAPSSIFYTFSRLNEISSPFLEFSSAVPGSSQRAWSASLICLFSRAELSRPDLSDGGKLAAGPAGRSGLLMELIWLL